MIINTASMAAFQAPAGMSAYAASKGAVVGNGEELVELMDVLVHRCLRVKFYLPDRK